MSDDTKTRPARAAALKTRPTTAPSNFPRALRRAVLASAAAILVGGCSNFLPQVGPTAGDIVDPNPEREIDYAIAELDSKAVQAARKSAPIAFGENQFREQLPLRTGLIGRGDLLTISIWEPVEDGLLTAVGSKQALIEQVEVDDNGNVFVPYAGTLRASGRTMAGLRAAIIEGLREKTTDPQVTVTRAEYRSRGVSVQGSVGVPGVQPLEPQTRRLLPMLAAAGGASTPPYATKVTVRRGAHAATAYLDRIYADPEANIALRNGDIVLVENEDRFFNAFGAVGRSGRQPMRGPLTLLDAITQVGGLDGQTASATGVFVFRREPADVVSQLTLLPRREAHGMDPVVLSDLGGDRPVVYQLALNSADGMFLAGAFEVREGDTLYVTEAPYSQFRKVLSVIVPTLGTAGSVNSLAVTTGQ